MRRFLLLLVALLAALFLGGCVTFQVTNVSEVGARVLIRPPDSARGHTKFINAADSESTFSTHGGSFTITTLPDEEYRQMLLDVREQIGQRLFEESATLTGAEVAQLVERMTQLTENLEALGREGASCGGSVTDFGSVTGVLSWDDAAQKWALSCSVRNEDLLGD